MKKLRKRFVTAGLVFITACFCFFPEENVDAYAASIKANRQQACKLYKKFLSKNESKFNAYGDAARDNTEGQTKASGFMLVDLDKDGVPELIVCHPTGWRSDDIYVYTYSAKRMIQVKDIDGGFLPVSVNTSANGGHDVYQCRKKHLHVVASGGWWSYENVYTMKNGKLKLIAKTEEDSMVGNIKYYEKNEKEVSKKKYQSFLKKCKMKNDRNQKWYFINNTKANRKKFIK